MPQVAASVDTFAYFTAWALQDLNDEQFFHNGLFSAAMSSWYLGTRSVAIMKELPIERVYRGVRALRIVEGTSEIQRFIIARALLAE